MIDYTASARKLIGLQQLAREQEQGDQVELVLTADMLRSFAVTVSKNVEE